MRTEWKIGVWMLAGLALGAMPRAAVAQSGGYPGGYNPAGAGGRPQVPLAVQMYGNPAMNPYLNPYGAAQMTATAPDMAMYFFAANQMNGGIGSGVISGTRPAPGVPAGSAPIPPGEGRKPAAGMLRNRPITGKSGPATVQTRPAAEMPLATSVPGASASRFFTRGYQSGDGAARYYNRPQTNFQNNGR